MRPKAYEELGKTALALAVAFIVFTFIKPFSEGKLNYDINKGGNKNES